MSLPFEILNEVGSYIQNPYQCVQVSRYWSTSFQANLYHQVNITSMKRWERFLQCIKLNDNLGKLVKHLNFDYCIDITRTEFEELSIYFPLLETLEFNPKLWKDIISGKLPVWKKINRLPTIYNSSVELLKNNGSCLSSLTLDGSVIHQYPKMLESILCFTPYLKSLCLYGFDQSNDFSTERSQFELSDLLNLHNTLPMLQELKLIDITLFIQPEDIQKVTNNNQYSCMRTLIVHGLISDSIWLSLIAKIYPNLYKLDLNQKLYQLALGGDVFQLQMEQLQRVKNGLIQIATECKLLKRVRLVPLGRFYEEGYLEFYKKKKGKLISVDGINYSSTNNLKSLYDHIIHSCDNENTDCLKIKLWRHLDDINQIMKPLSLFKKLKELELNCGRFAYTWKYGCDIDTILNYCPQLKKFKLSMIRMTVKDEYNQINNNIQIESIELNKVHFNTKSINVLTNMCRKLKELKLIRCIKDKDELEQRIYIQLPNELLETLIIDKIYLGLNRIIERCNIDVALIAIETNKFNQQQQWYHLNQDSLSSIPQLNKLNEHQFNQIQSYQMDDSHWNNLEENLIRSTYRSFQHWENDIPYGHLFIQCKSIITHLIYNEVSL